MPGFFLLLGLILKLLFARRYINHYGVSLSYSLVMVTNMLLFLNLGGSEVVLILFVVLLLFGANKIPELARGLGKGMREFKDATNGIQREIQESARKIQDEAQKTIDSGDSAKDNQPK